jgi:phosphatidylinositol-4-phosphate 3-kinase
VYKGPFFNSRFQGLKAFICSFPDIDVRRMAVNWLRSLGSDELVDYLPQLVQALKHETWEGSPLASFLLERALTSPRVAHHLYWLLAQVLPGEFPQVRSKTYTCVYSVYSTRAYRFIFKYGLDLMC